uniref:Si:ch211-269k10.5 n=1 Tax=Cyprinus carpio TaxID=7962 RepID=A0A8C1WUB8_CYPCA
MRYTFKPDDCMVISIPLGNLRNTEDGQLMPEKFTCVFKDAYKVFLKGRPKELGAVQLSIGVFIICIGSLITLEYDTSHLVYTLPSALFIASGILTFAAGNSPFMPVVKLSFIFNIISLFWSIAAIVLCSFLGEGHWGLNNRPDYNTGVSYSKQVFGHSSELMLSLSILLLIDCHVFLQRNMFVGLKVVIGVLCGLELILALILIFWESKAVCRSHFNTLVI